MNINNHNIKNPENQLKNPSFTFENGFNLNFLNGAYYF